MWHFQLDGQTRGPADAKVISNLLLNKLIDEATLVRHVLENDWHRLDETDLILLLNDPMSPDEETALDMGLVNIALSKKWYYFDRKKCGPVSAKEIIDMLEIKKLSGATHVMQYPDGKWDRLKSTELYTVFQVIRSARKENFDTRNRKKLSSKGLKRIFTCWLILEIVDLLMVLPLYGAISFSHEFTAWLASKTDLSTIYYSIGALLILGIAVTVLMYVLLYHFWNTIQDGYVKTTPGKAVGNLFIPFYNYYWIFRAFSEFSNEVNKYIDRHGSENSQEPSRKSVGWISMAYSILITLHSILSCCIGQMNRSIDTNLLNDNGLFISSAAFFEYVRPIITSNLFYGCIGGVLLIWTYLDFYLTTRSILIAEE